MHYKLQANKISAADIFVVNVVAACGLLASAEAINQVFYMNLSLTNKALLFSFSSATALSLQTYC